MGERWDFNMLHVVDVDGQLLAIDPEVVDAASLLARAGRPTDRELWHVRAGERHPLGSRQRVRLSRDEVLFFESEPARRADFALVA